MDSHSMELTTAFDVYYLSELPCFIDFIQVSEQYHFPEGSEMLWLIPIGCWDFCAITWATNYSLIEFWREISALIYNFTCEITMSIICQNQMVHS